MTIAYVYWQSLAGTVTTCQRHILSSHWLTAMTSLQLYPSPELSSKVQVRCEIKTLVLAYMSV